MKTHFLAGAENALTLESIFRKTPKSIRRSVDGSGSRCVKFFFCQLQFVFHDDVSKLRDFTDGAFAP